MKIIDVYTDGSFKENKPSWSFVCYFGGEEIFKDCGVLSEDLAASRQIAGELSAVMRAVRWAKQNNHKLHIISDLQGIQFWVADLFDSKAKPWKTNNDLTKKYRDYMLKNSDYIHKMTWQKGHVGNLGNETADNLASKAYLK